MPRCKSLQLGVFLQCLGSYILLFLPVVTRVPLSQSEANPKRWLHNLSSTMLPVWFSNDLSLAISRSHCFQQCHLHLPASWRRWDTTVCSMGLLVLDFAPRSAHFSRCFCIGYVSMFNLNVWFWHAFFVEFIWNHWKLENSSEMAAIQEIHWFQVCLANWISYSRSHRLGDFRNLKGVAMREKLATWKGLPDFRYCCCQNPSWPRVKSWIWLLQDVGFLLHVLYYYSPGLHEALLTFQTVGPIAMEVQTAMPQTDSANALCRAMLHWVV